MVDLRLSHLRDSVLEDLAFGFARDELSPQTHESRVQAALDADSVRELQETIWDLPAGRDLPVLLVLGAVDGVEVLDGGRWLASEAARAAWLLGRSPRCDVQLRSISVSRRHALLVKRGRCWSLIDLESRYGTWVNGVKVRRRRLAPGDRIDLGPDAPLQVLGQRRSRWL